MIIAVLLGSRDQVRSYTSAPELAAAANLLQGDEDEQRPLH
jgi:F420-0:gamma-glutamyl ligase